MQHFLYPEIRSPGRRLDGADDAFFCQWIQGINLAEIRIAAVLTSDAKC
jgi:hypothetical protein